MGINSETTTGQGAFWDTHPALPGRFITKSGDGHIQIRMWPSPDLVKQNEGLPGPIIGRYSYYLGMEGARVREIQDRLLPIIP